MATSINIDNIIKDKLFQTGFINDETPLDAYNMNLLVNAIKALSENTTYTGDNLDKEVSSRQFIDRYITGTGDINGVDVQGPDDAYADSNTKLRADITAVQTTCTNSIAEITNRLDSLDSTYATDKAVSEAIESVKSDVNGTIGPIGQSVSDLTDKINLLAKEDLISKAPTIGVNWVNVGEFEAGSTVTVQYKALVSDGEYKYENNGSKKMGVSFKSAKATFNNSTKTTQNSYFSPIIVNENTNLTATCEVTSTDGSNPINKLGVEDPTLKYLSKKETHTAYVTGYRMGCFYGAVSDNVTLEALMDENLCSKIIRPLNKTNGTYKSGELEMNIPVGTQTILIACPSTKPGPTNVINTAVHARMNTLCGSENILTTQFVEGANGESGVEYNIWMYKPSVPYTQPAQLKITLG